MCPTIVSDFMAYLQFFFCRLSTELVVVGREEKTKVYTDILCLVNLIFSKTDTDRLRYLIKNSLAWFPHVWVGGATVSNQQI